MSFYPSGTGNYSRKTKKRVTKILIVTTIAVVLLLSSMLSRPLSVDSLPNAHKINVIMEAKVYRDGVLIAERINDDDLLLHNFLNATMGLFAWPNDALYNVYMFSGNEQEYRPFVFWNTTASETIWDSSEFDLEGRLMVALGEGTTAPARDDDNAENPMVTYNVYDVSSIDADSFTVTFMWTSDGSYDWSEACISRNFYSEDFPGQPNIPLARDTFTPIAVVNGDTLVCNYTFEFGTGYTSNAIKLMYVWILGADQDEDKTVTLTDGAGTSRTVRLYTDDPTDTEFYGRIASANNGGWISLTDSSSGIPSRSAYRLLGSSILINSLSAVEEAPDWDVTVKATLIPSSSITITCAGVFMYIAYVGGTGYFLMWALSHSGVYVAENTPVQATFTMEM